MTHHLATALAALKSSDAYTLARARAMLSVYDRQWGEKWPEYEIIEAELEFVIPLLNPESSKPSRTFDLAGKMDVVARHRKTRRVVVIEHKTTSDSVAPDSDYWDRLRLDSQCSAYYLAAATLLERDVEGVLYDVLSKPAQRPCQVATLDANGFKIVLDPAGNRVMTKDGKKPRETGDAEKGWVVQGQQETPNEFEARLLAVMCAEPHEYFAQREVARLDSDIIEFMGDAWSLSQQILYFRSRNLWPRNPNACKQFGTCEFFDLCCGRASVDTITYRKKEGIHSELVAQNGNAGRELLTNSRNNALRKCARFHDLRYEQGVERVGEEAEALTFGTLIHEGLEAYFKSIKQHQIRET